MVCGQLSQVIENVQNRSQVQYVRFDSEQFEQNLFNQIDNFSFKQEVVVLCDSEESVATLQVNKRTGTVELLGNVPSTIDSLQTEVGVGSGDTDKRMIVMRSKMQHLLLRCASEAAAGELLFYFAFQAAQHWYQ